MARLYWPGTAPPEEPPEGAALNCPSPDRKPDWLPGAGKAERCAGNGPVPVRGISRITSPESDTSAVKYRHPTNAGRVSCVTALCPSMHQATPLCKMPKRIMRIPFYRDEPARTTVRPP